MSLPVCCSKVLRNGLLKSNILGIGSQSVRHSKIWEPDYLILAKTKTPEYDAINVQIRGYDFVILENFQKYIQKLTKILEIDVTGSWAAPQQDLRVNKFKPMTSVVENGYDLRVYERNIQVIDVKSHIMPLFIEAIVTACPPGIKVSVHEHTQEMENIRYVPDKEIKELQNQLIELETVKKKK